jgi:hypothetical protein
MCHYPQRLIQSRPPPFIHQHFPEGPLGSLAADPVHVVACAHVDTTSSHPRCVKAEPPMRTWQ